MLLILADRSEHLVPYWRDQEALIEQLAHEAPHNSLRLAPVHETRDPPRVDEPGAASALPSGSLVLLLGDLGCLRGRDRMRERQWLAYARHLRQAGVTPLALLPCAPRRCPATLRQAWKALPWEQPRAKTTPASSSPSTSPLEQLLPLLAAAIRLEPGFVRAARYLLPEGRRDAGLESDVWQHPHICSTHSDAASWDPTQLNRWRARFDVLDPPTRERLLTLQKTWRMHLPGEIWFEELLSLPPSTRQLEAVRADASLAEHFYIQLSAEARSEDAAALSKGAPSWYQRSRRRLSDHAYNGQVGQALHQLTAHWDPEDPEYRDKPGYDPRYGRSNPQEEWRCAVRQIGPHLNVSRERVAVSSGSPLGELHTGNGEIKVERYDKRPLGFWENGAPPPPWATDWGWDVYGAWVEFAIEDKTGQPVTQRMRWIEPGRFWMGSPVGEPERRNNEGPRHEVTIQEGFWLFETACTQALWEAVTGENPSRFQGPERPVEQVSWNQVQGFIETINARLPGLALSLPSEAQWEYACRAGSDTAFSFGETITPEQVNYAGNHQGTVPVKALPPNGWGLYQMHGNVDEWVQDAWHSTYKGAPKDGSAWESAESGALRVIRGGGWSSAARFCRSAYRDRDRPDDRSSNLGFRCARVQVRESGTPEAERVELARPGPRSGSGRGEMAPSRAAGQGHVKPQLLRLDIAASDSAELPDASGLEIRSDREVLRLQRCAKPAWASAMGRDRFGLWAEIPIEPVSPNKAPQAVPENVSKPVIQRLRWIPPGRFLMGSPEDEPGRWGTEGPQHSVTVGQGFWLFDTPCTQALWVALGLENPSRFQDPALPVEQVSWDEVQQEFLPALNERIPGFILPSEAQWEYACRAGSDTAFSFGETITPEQANYGRSQKETIPVKALAPNGWGLYQMHGNVDEWVQDAWHGTYEGAPKDGSAWESAEPGASRVIRGGSWDVTAGSCRSAFRLRYGPGRRYNNLGFRCARVQVL
ncbi:formylglycine-generating enzyme family protein [Marichromatium gracile]|uniref:formylglycine-generating enzyme family protein n=1 Tax=Marichromatium gracile TaxID=1048 RepID=UPI001FB73D8C|nr:formylglycine-generating enzyme family protein [Marichromatium gracile]